MWRQNKKHTVIQQSAKAKQSCLREHTTYYPRQYLTELACGGVNRFLITYCVSCYFI